MDANSGKLDMPRFMTGVAMEVVGIVLCIGALLGFEGYELFAAYRWPLAIFGAALAVAGFITYFGALRAMKTNAVNDKKMG
jgi:hypothetical protein